MTLLCKCMRNDCTNPHAADAALVERHDGMPVITSAPPDVVMTGELWETFGVEHGGVVELGTAGRGLGVVRYRHVEHDFPMDRHRLRRIA